MPAQRQKILFDEFDRLYRRIWGRELHHGLWRTGSETNREAKQNLSEKLIEHLQPKGRIVDIGCGYGSLSLELADRFGCTVTAVTNSTAQAKRIPSHKNVTVLNQDWLNHSLRENSFDQAVALESLSYFPNFHEFHKATKPVLKKRGKIVIADWFARTRPGWLLKKIAGSIDLPPWRTTDDFLKISKTHDFELKVNLDLTDLVAPTWTKFGFAALRASIREPSLIPPASRIVIARPTLLLAFPLLRFAYFRRDLDYRLLVLEKRT